MIDRVRTPEADKLWAIEALRREAEFLLRHVHRSDVPLSEEHGAYSVDLALFVARLRDPRAIEALALATGIAPAVPAALVEFGDAAVDAVIHTLDEPFLHRSGRYTLRKLLHSGRLSREMAEKAARALAR